MFRLLVLVHVPLTCTCKYLHLSQIIANRGGQIIANLLQTIIANRGGTRIR